MNYNILSFTSVSFPYTVHVWAIIFARGIITWKLGRVLSEHFTEMHGKSREKKNIYIILLNTQTDHFFVVLQKQKLHQLKIYSFL